jgi:hypothetical protein
VFNKQMTNEQLLDKVRQSLTETDTEDGQ